MSESRAHVFAKVALQSFAHEGTFSVEFSSLEELEEAAAAFRDLGCTVAHIPDALALAVIVPPDKP